VRIFKSFLSLPFSSPLLHFPPPFFFLLPCPALLSNCFFIGKLTKGNKTNNRGVGGSRSVVLPHFWRFPRSPRLAFRHPPLLRSRLRVVLYRVTRDGSHVHPLACPPRAPATPCCATTDVIPNNSSRSNNNIPGRAAVFRLR
jgi:hypothetical protein